MPRKKKVTVINEQGEEAEQSEEEDDESIVDPLADSRSTTPALLSPTAQFDPVHVLPLSHDASSGEKGHSQKATKVKNDSAVWKSELLEIIEEDKDTSKQDDTAIVDDLKNLHV
jgi:hypothetical protein